MPSVDGSLRPELNRQCTMWTNKSQIELTSTRSVGDINQGAYLNGATPMSNATMKPATTAPVAAAKPVATAAPKMVPAADVNGAV